MFAQIRMGEPKEDASYFKGSKFVTELSPKDFDSVSSWKLKGNKCAIVLFYKPGCPYCKAMKDEYVKLGEKASFFNVYALNADKYGPRMTKIREELPYLITSYPTIIIYQYGKPLEEYKGERKWKELTKACIRTCTGGSVGGAEGYGKELDSYLN